MSFISYAQNQEDVMLYRALREVKEGFYIDVGAQDPVIDSVTKAFYERGWRGINIEPNEEYFRRLLDDRPHDVNLLTAVGREPDTISFYEVVHTGLSTTNAVYARGHAEAGYEVHLRNVACTTLDRICLDSGVRPVHFLKIDVEGSERAVLEGFSFDAVRPWVVIVEATEPNSTREVYLEWEHLLVGNRYQFVYFDGLNRFYIATEHADLTRHFSCPPNPFDQYVTYNLWCAREKLEQTQAAEHNALVNSLNEVLAEAQSLRNGIIERGTQIESLRNAAAEQIEERVQQLESLRKTLAERDLQLEERVKLVAERDREAGALRHDQDQQRSELLAQVHQLSGNLTAIERRLRSIRTSVSWKLTSPLREIRRAAVRVSHLVGRILTNQPISRERNRAQAGPNVATSGVTGSEEIAARLTEPARSHYHALRETLARRP
jgi:FkbM family methyltransferase